MAGDTTFFAQAATPSWQRAMPGRWPSRLATALAAHRPRLQYLSSRSFRASIARQSSYWVGAKKAKKWRH